MNGKIQKQNKLTRYLGVLFKCIQLLFVKLTDRSKLIDATKQKVCVNTPVTTKNCEYKSFTLLGPILQAS